MIIALYIAGGIADAVATLYFAWRYRDFRKFLAGAFFVSSGILFYLYLADVSVPLLGTGFVETPRISGVRSIVHFILFLLCIYSGFVRAPKPRNGRTVAESFCALFDIIGLWGPGKLYIFWQPSGLRCPPWLKQAGIRRDSRLHPFAWSGANEWREIPPCTFVEPLRGLSASADASACGVVQLPFFGYPEGHGSSFLPRR